MCCSLFLSTGVEAYVLHFSFKNEGCGFAPDQHIEIYDRLLTSSPTMKSIREICLFSQLNEEIST